MANVALATPKMAFPSASVALPEKVTNLGTAADVCEEAGCWAFPSEAHNKLPRQVISKYRTKVMVLSSYWAFQHWQCREHHAQVQQPDNCDAVTLFPRRMAERRGFGIHGCSQSQTVWVGNTWQARLSSPVLAQGTRFGGAGQVRMPPWMATKYSLLPSARNRQCATRGKKKRRGAARAG